MPLVGQSVDGPAFVGMAHNDGATDGDCDGTSDNEAAAGSIIEGRLDGISDAVPSVGLEGTLDGTSDVGVEGTLDGTSDAAGAWESGVTRAAVGAIEVLVGPSGITVVDDGDGEGVDLVFIVILGFMGFIVILGFIVTGAMVGLGSGVIIIIFFCLFLIIIIGFIVGEPSFGLRRGSIVGRGRIVGLLVGDPVGFGELFLLCLLPLPMPPLSSRLRMSQPPPRKSTALVTANQRKSANSSSFMLGYSFCELFFCEMPPHTGRD